MNRDILLEIVLDQKESFEKKNNLIDRDILLEKYLSTQQVVIISGVRRCGKSSLLSIIKNKLHLGVEDYCYLNLDDERIVADVSILDEMYSLHLELYKKEPVFFFDEIQTVNNWEKFVNRMYEKGRKLFVTGSNAKLLSSEISTSLTGRNKVIELYPFSFNEYLRYIKHNYNINVLTTKQKALLKNDFNAYFEYGGFPLVIKENDLDLMNGWFQDVIYRDIIARYKLTQVNEIKQIALYLLSNVSKLFSYSTLKTISGIKSDSSIKNYLQYYEKSYLFYYLSKFDYSVKKQMMNSKKVYAIDNSLVNKLGFGFSANKGRMLENIVFIELLRRKKEVYYFSEKNECDFLIKEGLQIVEAIQVVYSLNKENFEREFGGLKEAMDKFTIPQGLFIVNDSTDVVIERDDIKIVSISKWLLDFKVQ
jgi:predicted AAA+ superfamily ATPase